MPIVPMNKEKRIKVFATVSLFFIFLTAVGYSMQEYINYKDNGSYVEVKAIKVNKPYDVDLRTVKERGCVTASAELVNLTGLNTDITKATESDRFVAYNKVEKQLAIEVDQVASMSQTPVIYLCKGDNTTFSSLYIFHHFIVH